MPRASLSWTVSWTVSASAVPCYGLADPPPLLRDSRRFALHLLLVAVSIVVAACRGACRSYRRRKRARAVAAYHKAARGRGRGTADGATAAATRARRASITMLPRATMLPQGSDVPQHGGQPLVLDALPAAQQQSPGMLREAGRPLDGAAPTTAADGPFHHMHWRDGCSGWRHGASRGGWVPTGHAVAAPLAMRAPRVR